MVTGVVCSNTTSMVINQKFQTTCPIPLTRFLQSSSRTQGASPALVVIEAPTTTEATTAEVDNIEATRRAEELERSAPTGDFDGTS